MNPVLLDLGIIKIYWYSVCIFLGILIGGTLVLRESKRFNINEDFMLNLFFWDIIVSLIGARLYFVAFNWEFYSNNLLDILKVWEGGMAIHGAILFGSIFTVIYSKKYKVNTLFLFDLIVVGLIIGQAIGRWGNFFNGEAHGVLTTYESLKHMYIPEFIINGMHIGNQYYYPTFFFESIWCFIGFIIMLFLRRKKYLKVGELTSFYLAWYSIERFFVEGLRTDSLMLGSIRIAQVVSIIMFVVGIVMFILFKRGNKFNNQYKETIIESIKF